MQNSPRWLNCTRFHCIGKRWCSKIFIRRRQRKEWGSWRVWLIGKSIDCWRLMATCCWKRIMRRIQWWIWRNNQPDSMLIFCHQSSRNFQYKPTTNKSSKCWWFLKPSKPKAKKPPSSNSRNSTQSNNSSLNPNLNNSSKPSSTLKTFTFKI